MTENLKQVRETEKAVQFELEIYLVHIEKNVTRKFWVPKSMLKADWFIDKKINEIMSEFEGHEPVLENFGEEYGIEVHPEIKSIL